MHTITTRIALALASFGFTAFLAAGAAQAAPAGDAGNGDRQEQRLERTCARLACTAAQKSQIASIRAADAPQIKAARDAIRGLRQQMKAEWHKPQPDARALERIDGQIDAQRDKVQDLKRAALLKIHALLTPEQRTKFAAEKEQRGGKGKGRHGKGKGRHGKGRHAA